MMRVLSWRTLAAALPVVALAQAPDPSALIVQYEKPDREQFLRLACVKLGRDLATQVYPEIEQLDAP